MASEHINGGGDTPPADNGTGGSPKGDGLASLFDGPIIDPGEIGDKGRGDSETGGNTGAETGKRKRGRPKGSGTKTQGPKVHLDISGVEKLLLALHIGAAKVFKIAELEIDQEEATQMASAMARVQRHYPILDKIGDKAIDHANLVSVFAGIYGSRFFAYQMRKAANNAQSVGPTVVGFPHGGNA